MFSKKSGKVFIEYSLILLILTIVSISFFTIYGERIKDKIIEITKVFSETSEDILDDISEFKKTGDKEEKEP